MRFEANSFAQPRWFLVPSALAFLCFALDWWAGMRGIGAVGQTLMLLAVLWMFRQTFTIYRLERVALYLSQGWGERRIALSNITSIQWLERSHLILVLEYEDKTMRLYPKTPEVFLDQLERHRAAPASA